MRLARLSSLAFAVVLALAAPGLAGDTTPPTVTEVRALDGVGGEVVLPATVGFEPASLVVTFSEDIDAATVSVDTFRLVGSGGDGTFGDANEVEITPVSVTPTAGNVVTMDLGGVTLADEVYQLTIFGTDLSNGLVGHWQFDEGTGGTAYDSSPVGNDGAINGATWTAGRIGDALNFDGNDYVSVPYASAYDITSSLTLSVWVKPSDWSGNRRVIARDMGPELWLLSGSGGTELHCRLVDVEPNLLVSGLPPTDEWTHIATTYDGSDRTIYQNGVAVAGTSATGQIRTDTAGIVIGTKGGGGAEAIDYFKGVIDDVRVYDRALTQAELVRLAGSSPPYAITDLAGNVLDGDEDGSPGPDYECTFTVEAAVPSMVSTTPGDTETGVEVTTDVTVTFTERMNETDTALAFSISPVVAGATVCIGSVLTFTPDADLASETLYTVTVDTGAKDLAGKPIVADYVFTFTTRDAIPPTVTDIRADGALLPGTSFDFAPSEIVVTFSEDIDPATVGTDTFRLVRSGGDGTFTDGNEVEIVPVSVTPTAGDVVTMDLGGAAMLADAYEITAASYLGGAALSFDGADDFVAAPQWLTGSSSQVTIEYWCKPKEYTQASVLLHRASFNDMASVWLWSGTAAGFNFNIPLDETASWYDDTLQLDCWYHVAGTYDGAQVKLYVDGEVKATHAVAKVVNWDSGYYGSYIGGDGYNGWGLFVNAEIDEVRIWSVARTESDIQANMHCALSGGEAGLMAYYRFNEGQGQTAQDSSAMGSHGTLGGSSSVDSADPTWLKSTAPISGGIADLAGNVLDGEFTGSFPSGDTIPGGDFVCTFEITAPKGDTRKDWCVARGGGPPFGFLMPLALLALALARTRRTCLPPG